MKISSLTSIYFSPTKTTQKIATTIAHIINPARIHYYDITNVKKRNDRLPLFENDLVILGSPVYEGRLPHEAEDYFKSLTAKNVPVILVVVYGGRAYEDCLIELYDIAINAGFIPIASAAFIGEHSFSTQKTPIASKRPDSDDIAVAQRFGLLIKEKLTNVDSAIELKELPIPGKRPYRKRIVDKIKISPITNIKNCSQCGMCITICPNDAIYEKVHIKTNKQKCILCCSCIKICPHKARYIKNVFVKLYSKILFVECKKRKEPEVFL